MRAGPTPSRGANVRRIVAAFVALVVASAIVVEVRSSVAETNRLTSSGYVASQNLQYAYYQCLSHQVKSLVSSRERVWVSTHDPDGHKNMSLKKVVAPYAPVAYQSTGVVKLTLVGARGTKGSCLGMRVKAESPDGTVRFGSGSLVGSTKDLPPDQR